MVHYMAYDRPSARRMDSREVSASFRGVDRAFSSTLGSRRGDVARLGWSLGGRGSNRVGAHHNSARNPGTRVGNEAFGRTPTPRGSGPQESGPSGPRAESRIGSADRTGDSGRSPVAVALDLQEHANSRQGTES